MLLFSTVLVEKTIITTEHDYNYTFTSRFFFVLTIGKWERSHRDIVGSFLSVALVDLIYSQVTSMTIEYNVSYK